MSSFSGNNGNKFATIAAYVVTTIFVVFAMFPIYWVLNISLLPESKAISSDITYFPWDFHYQNYIDVWAQSDFPLMMWNSLKTTVYTMLICITGGTFAAYSFSRYQYRWRTKLLLFFVVIRMFPVVLIIVPLFLLLKKFGLLDTSLGLAIAYSSFMLPLFIWMMKGFFDGVPKDLEKAARIDGCTSLGAMVRVMLPLAKGGLAATSIFVAIGAWNEYMLALLFTSSGGSRTWPVGLKMMIGEFQLPWGLLAASGIISIIPVIILFAMIQRAMVSGLTQGAVKG